MLMNKEDIMPFMELTIRLLNSKSSNEYFAIIKDATPGECEAVVAANILLSHSVRELALAIKNLDNSNNGHNNCGNSNNNVQPENLSAESI